MQRHVTRQKILNWKQSLRFPSRPRVSHEGVDLMEKLLCEPEDRLGSQSAASVLRPNSMLINARRSGFMPSTGNSGSVDGAEFIKVILIHFARRSILFVLIVTKYSPIRGSGELTG